MSQDFRPFFCFKDSAWVPKAPYKQAKTVTRTFFVFAKIFDRKVRKSRVHVLSLAGTSRTSKFFFRYGRLNIFKLLLLIFLTAHRGLGFITLFTQYYSALCRPSDHTLGRLRTEIRTRDGRSRGRDTNH